MRLQLQQHTQHALYIKEKEHKKLVNEYLNAICSKAADSGFYAVEVKFRCLSDGLPLTGKDVEEFANSFEHPLTYTPPKDKKYATLSWHLNENENQLDHPVIE